MRAPIPPKNTLGPAERFTSSAVKIFNEDPACSKPLQKIAAKINNQKMTPRRFFSSPVCPPKNMIYPKNAMVITTATSPKLPANDSKASSIAPELTKKPSNTISAPMMETTV